MNLHQFNVVLANIFLIVCSYEKTAVAVELSQHGSMNVDTRSTESQTISTPVNRSTDLATIEKLNSICGQQQVSSESTFPWIAAVLYKNNDSRRLLGLGSLISAQTVVTVAHGFYVHSNMKTVEPEDIVVSMNWYKFNDLSQASSVDIERVIIHPDYNYLSSDADADLAVVQLKQRVAFTDSVRPICMWRGSKDADEILHKSGTIVSFGGDRSPNGKQVPTLVNATVVSELTCIRSNYMFTHLISNRTLCAGNRGEIGPCLGDSGAGLMIKEENKWILRGILSSAAKITDRCVSNEYAVYTDIADFTKWIQSNMLL